MAHRETDDGPPGVENPFGAGNEIREKPDRSPLRRLAPNGSDRNEWIRSERSRLARAAVERFFE